PGPRLTCVAGPAGGPALAGTAEAHLYRVGAGLEAVEGFEHVEGRDRWYTPWGGPPDVRSLSVSPTGTVLVNVHVGGIVRSTDGGRTWRPTIDIDADVHQVLALDAGAAVAACAEGLATSDDDGATWTIHDDGLHATYSRAVAVAGDAALFSVSDGPGGRRAAIYRRPLAGGPIERLHGGLPGDLGGNVDTFRLAGGPDGAAALATPAGDLYASCDEGSTWEQVAAGLPPVRCLVLP
ncbi:MAG: hypothetical protein M3Q48_02790, partial [Actinomycetota bacterium]|nr:hypothetical protein [Actinomycetota bacterium]